MGRGVVGLELDTGMIRAVEMSGGKVAAAGWVQIPDSAVVDGVLQEADVVSAALTKLWSDAKFGSRNVVLGIYNQGVMMRLITFPRVPKDKLERALRLQAGDYFPIPLSQMVLDFAVIGETEGEGGPAYEVLLVAVKKEPLLKALEVLKKCRLTPVVVDATPLALLRTLPKDKLAGTTVIVDLAMGLSSLMLSVEGMPRFARVMPVHLRQYMGSLSAAPAVGGDEHEYVAAAAEGAADAVYKRWSTMVANEISASINFYAKQDDEVNVNRIVLSGRGAKVTGLAGFLADEVGVPVEVAKPEVKLNGKMQVDVSGPEFAVAVGLALRGLEV